MKRQPWLGVAMAYVGTVIGAGFASGQEIWQFFSRHGAWGGLGIVLAGSMFFFVGQATLERGRSGTRHFSSFLLEVYGPRSIVFDYLTTIVLAIGVGVVAVGGGAALSLIAGWPRPMSAGLILAAVIVTPMFGSTMVVRVNSILVPCLLALTLIIGLWPVHTHRTVPFTPDWWWLSAMLYVSYNLFTGMATLLGLGATLSSRRESWWAALVASILLTGTALLEHRVLLAVGNVDSLPMMFAANAIGSPMRMLFGFSLLSAMYTTGIGEAYALMGRYGKIRVQWLWLSGIMIAWPFQALVAFIYPVLGVLSVAFWMPLIVPRRIR